MQVMGLEVAVYPADNELIVVIQPVRHPPAQLVLRDSYTSGVENRAQTLAMMPVVFGFLVICMPLALWLTYRLVFAPFIQMDENPPGPLDCIRRSWALTRGSWWRIFGLTLLVSLIAIAGVCLCGVGLIAAIPVIYFAFAHAYEQLRARAHSLGTHPA